MRNRFTVVIALLVCGSASAYGQFKAVNPKVVKMISEISEERITSTLKKLESFGTRYLLSSQDDPKRGIGAARKWIFEEMRGYSPRLELSYDQYRVKKIDEPNSRVPKDADLFNIIAVLPGTVRPEQRILVTAHYDSLQLAARTGESMLGGESPAAADPNSEAPGVTDDASGVACVMELARIFSQYEFEKTLVFVAFAGEEEGLLGSSLYAAKAKKESQRIEALLNNDIIGSDVSGSGRTANRRVMIYSVDPIDSPSRTLARYVRDVGERYVPSMKVDLVFRPDRFGRGGDHTPFHLEGFAAVRLTSAEENLANQHTATDTLANTSIPYIVRVTKVNGAVAASLALAPAAPVVTEEVERNKKKRTNLLLSRGESRYDAKLKWKALGPEKDLLGFAIVMRSTTAPFWEREIFVGNVTEFSFPDVSIDEWVFGVKAVDKEGNESLVTPYVPVAREKRVVEVY
jgi:hypothetical protein